MPGRSITKELSGARHRAGDLGQEQVAVEGLRQKCDRPLVHGPCTSLAVTISGEDDDGNSVTRIGQVTLEPQRVTEFPRSEEHTSELQSLMRISYAVFCLKNNNTYHTYITKQRITNT